jgi:hypothetical protein
MKRIVSKNACISSDQQVRCLLSEPTACAGITVEKAATPFENWRNSNGE